MVLRLAVALFENTLSRRCFSESPALSGCEELVLNVVSAITNISYFCLPGRGGALEGSLASPQLVARLARALAPVLQHPNPEVRATNTVSGFP